MTSAHLRLATAIIVATVVADQVTKAWALRALDDGHTIALLPTLEFDLLFNNGFSFGTGQGQGRLIGIGVIVMVGYLLVQLARATARHRVVLFSVILGGAIGNLIDRIVRAESGVLTGSVVDFIDVSWFAVFNVADIFVVCGAIAFGLWETFVAPPPSPAVEPSGAPDVGSESDDAVDA